MRIRRPWRVVAGTGTAAVLVGLGATAVAASDGVDLQDRGDIAPSESVTGGDLTDDSPSSADSPFDSPTDSADSADSAGSAD